jgi:hypothetical protein
MAEMQAGGGGRVRVKYPGGAGALDELREEWRADEAALAAEAFADARRGWPGPGKVHEQSELVVDVERRVSRFAEAHMVAFALLVLFAVVRDQGGAVLEGTEALEVIRVELEVAGGGAGTFPWAHAADA